MPAKLLLVTTRMEVETKQQKRAAKTRRTAVDNRMDGLPVGEGAVHHESCHESGGPTGLGGDGPRMPPCLPPLLPLQTLCLPLDRAFLSFATTAACATAASGACTPSPPPRSPSPSSPATAMDQPVVLPLTSVLDPSSDPPPASVAALLKLPGVHADCAALPIVHTKCIMW